MVSLTVFAAWLLSCTALTSASPAPRAASGYAPVPVTCPRSQLVRPAYGISFSESTYVQQRYPKASAALETWLASVDTTFQLCGFGNSSSGGSGGRGGFGKRGFGGFGGGGLSNSTNSTSSVCGRAPVVALASSGGGYRALLAGAGVIKGFDAREALTPVSGIYQALTYETGLSGGAWLLSSIVGNNWPTISQLQTTLWEPSFEYSVLVPEILLSPLAASTYSTVVADVASKAAAGFPTTLTDPWGRLLSTQLLYGTDGGVQDTLSGITSLSNFVSHNFAYPIMTALGVNTFDGACDPTATATQYEFHPYEFGSWDTGVSAFASTKYLGTTFSGGRPTGTCYNGYDNLGFVLGTSSTLFFEACGPIPALNTTDPTFLAVAEDLAEMVAPGAPGVPEADDFATYPNPFQNYPSSPLVSAQSTLNLVDGGVADQDNPIWPLLHRQVDVIIVNDNSDDTVDNYPNGNQLYTTYLVAQAEGLTRMPPIPPVDTFISQGLNQKPTFFGCNTANTATIIYIPNVDYTFDSGEPTTKLQYYPEETDGMIANGVATANYNGKADWPLCLACGMTKKMGGTLPAGCTACFTEYCFN